MKVIIIDDEPLARSIVSEYCEECQLEVLAECANGLEGIKAIQLHKPDLLFLDVQMPKITGFEMLEILEDYPPVIFTTAFDEYAIKAFEANAIDYLLKPFSLERFKQALEKVSRPQGAATKELLETAATNPVAQSRVVVRDGNNIKIIPVHNILYFMAADDYVKIGTQEGIYLKKGTMNFFENSLATHHFVRIHRSYLVNTQFISRIEPYEKDGHLLILSNGKALPVSRSGYVLLKEALGI
jgi:two-component system LytT family response regulator